MTAVYVNYPNSWFCDTSILGKLCGLLMAC